MQLKTSGCSHGGLLQLDECLLFKKDNWPFGPNILSSQLVLTTGDITTKGDLQRGFPLVFFCLLFWLLYRPWEIRTWDLLPLRGCCSDNQIRTSKLPVCHVSSLRVRLQMLDHAPRQRRRPGPNVWIFCLEDPLGRVSTLVSTLVWVCSLSCLFFANSWGEIPWQAYLSCWLKSLLRN